MRGREDFWTMQKFHSPQPPSGLEGRSRNPGSPQTGNLGLFFTTPLALPDARPAAAGGNERSCGKSFSCGELWRPPLECGAAGFCAEAQG